jgi:hypothetical protein
MSEKQKLSLVKWTAVPAGAPVRLKAGCKGKKAEAVLNLKNTNGKLAVQFGKEVPVPSQLAGSRDRPINSGSASRKLEPRR